MECEILIKDELQTFLKLNVSIDITEDTVDTNFKREMELNENADICDMAFVLGILQDAIEETIGEIAKIIIIES